MGSERRVTQPTSPDVELATANVRQNRNSQSRNRAFHRARQPAWKAANGPVRDRRAGVRALTAGRTRRCADSGASARASRRRRTGGAGTPASSSRSSSSGQPDSTGAESRRCFAFRSRIGPSRGERQRVAAVAGRHHAVEHVDARRDAREQVLRPADAHQVARLVLGQAARRTRAVPRASAPATSPTLNPPSA